MKKRRAADDEGMGLIEVTIALVLMMLMMLGFQSLLTGSIETYSQSRLTTLGQQVATDRLEQARRWPWDNLGTVNGSPRGTILDDVDQLVGTISFHIKTTIQDVLDPITLQSLNLRRISVEVSRTGSSQTPVRLETVIAAPKAQSIYNGVIGVTAHDLCWPNSAADQVANLLLQIDKGPSGPQTAFTNSAGLATFTQLVPTNVPAPVIGDYYQIGLADTSVYDLVNDPTLVPPINQTPVNNLTPSNWNNDVQFTLDPGQVVKKPLYVYQKGSFVAHVKSSSGLEVDVPGDLTMTKPDTGLTYTTNAVANTPATLTTITSTTGVVANIKPCDAVEYGFKFTPRGQPMLTVTSSALGGAYPSDKIVDGYATLPAPVSQMITVAYSDGTPAAGATVRITGGGPAPITTALVGTADNNGRVWFTLNYNTNAYTVNVDAQAPSVSAPNGWAAATSSIVVTASPTNKTVTVALPAPVTQVVALKFADGSPVAGATVSVTGGSGPANATTNASGQASFSLQPSTNPYTVSVAAQAPTSTAPTGWAATSTTMIVTTTPTLQTVTVPLPAPVAQAIALKFPDNSPVVGATVTVTGGSSPVTGTTDASGQLTMMLQPNFNAYTVNVATKLPNPPTVLIGWAALTSSVVVTQSPTPKTITVVPI